MINQLGHTVAGQDGGLGEIDLSEFKQAYEGHQRISDDLGYGVMAHFELSSNSIAGACFPMNDVSSNAIWPPDVSQPSSARTLHVVLLRGEAGERQRLFRVGH